LEKAVGGMRVDQDSATAREEWRKNWTVVAAATSGMSLAALSTSSFGVMVVPIEQDLGWSRTEIASGPTLISLMVISLSTFFGAGVDRFGPRLIGTIAVVVVCGATAAMSRIGHSLWQWWGLWAAIGLGSAVMPTVWLKPVSNSFFAGRGLAMAVVLSGSGISSFIVPRLTNSLVEAYGWRLAYLCLAAIWCAIVLPLVVLFLRGARATPNRAPKEGAAAPLVGLPGLTVREGFTSPVFYKLLFAAFASTFGGVALVLNLVPILRSTGLTAGVAASVAGVMGIATIAGRVFSGWLLDRFSGSVIAASASGIMIVLPATLLLAPGSIPGSMSAIAIYGMMGGALLPSLAYLASRHLGARSFGTLYGTINAVVSTGVGIGPLLANFIYDRNQSYNPVLWGTVPLFALGALILATLGRYPDFASRVRANSNHASARSPASP
jgi:MFS family permease